MNSKPILFAIRTLIHQSPEGEIHGTFENVADRILCEIGGPVDHCEDIQKEFELYLRNLGLEYLTANTPIAFFKSMSGELNFVDRKLVYES
ncbi:hypothetical protein ACN1C3_30185 [Pseudomonas sp. H11T01]|uniref:hypothetical protein n=1 Tax=Pseudomonas sp. H11T01 TaxID=3402749 RepID=UPI003AC58EB0